MQIDARLMRSVGGFVAWLRVGSFRSRLLVGAVQRQNGLDVDLGHSNAAIGFRGSEFAIAQLTFDFHTGPFLQSGGPFAQLIPADDTMPFDACLVFTRSFLFPADTGSEREASVSGAIRGCAGLRGLADESNEGGAILAKDFLSSFRAPIRRGDPVRRGLSRRAGLFFGGSRPDCL